MTFLSDTVKNLSYLLDKYVRTEPKAPLITAVKPRPSDRNYLPLSEDEVKLVSELRKDGHSAYSIANKIGRSRYLIAKQLGITPKRRKFLSLYSMNDVMFVRGKGVSFQEIGKKLGMSTSTAYRLYRKATDNP
jgi:DNA-binding CsgD family transcriptional regulator